MNRVFKRIVATLFMLSFSSYCAQADDRLVVRGYNTGQIKDTVEEVFHFQYGRQIPRWNSKVCAQFIGVPREVSGYFDQALVQKFHAFGIATTQKCVLPNLYILATNQMDGLVSAIIRRDPFLMQGIDAAPQFAENFQPPSKDALKNLKKAFPIRWFANIGIADKENKPPLVLPGAPPTYIEEPSNTSDLGSTTREDIISMVILVDMSKMDGVSWNSIIEYVSMVAMTYPNLTDYDSNYTVLGTFIKNKIPSAGDFHMTSLDDAFVRALYDADPAEPGTSAADYLTNVIVNELKH
ncbi:hypothetical protein GFGA_2c0087 (plasmid) [Gluconobacter frateurii NBRC 103465]|nr:hypothetical protein GFGA_2c0087 [Gluconobacter frateurii NBRC 103465]